MKLRTFLIIFTVSLVSTFFIYLGTLLRSPRYVPTVDAVDLRPTLNKEILTTKDYDLLFQQTGLTEPIINELRTNKNATEQIIAFQDDYLRDISVYTEYLPPVTICEMTGKETATGLAPAFQLAPYKNGYLFFSKSTITMNWRHGHMGLVTDDVRGIVLEALSPGTVSMEQHVSKWQYYPTFKMMRLKDVPQETLDAISEYADRYLKGLPYNILADKAQDPVTSTHCSLLIWQAFMPFGYDLDATGGLFVSPKNIASSPYLELLQIYGFDPNKDW